MKKLIKGALEVVMFGTIIALHFVVWNGITNGRGSLGDARDGSRDLPDLAAPQSQIDTEQSETPEPGARRSEKPHEVASNDQG